MSIVNDLELDFETACVHLQAVVEGFMDKAERLAYAAGEQTELKLKAPDTNQPLKPLKNKWDRNMAKAYQKVLTDAASQLREVLNNSESASQLKMEVDKVGEELEQKLSIMERLYSPLPATEARLFLDGVIEAIPTAAPMVSSIKAQLRQDLWEKDSNGIAFFQHHAKNNARNYIEHNISSPDDIALLPWEQANQIIDKFGPDTVKLQFIVAAYAMKQPVPWESSFTLKATDIVREMGWTNHHSSLPKKLNEIAKLAFALHCLLVKAVWIEGNSNGKLDASTPTGRMWDVLVDPRSELEYNQLNLFTGQIDEPTEVYITVRPGLWTEHYLNKAGCKAKEALYQFGYIAQDILRLDPYHDWLAFKLMAYLYPASRYHPNGEYRVRTLLQEALPIPEIEIARQNRHKGYNLKQRWDNFIKLLLNLQNPWQIVFDDETYPEWLRPGSEAPKPQGWKKDKIIERVLKAKITIKPPTPISELIASGVEPNKARQLKPAKLARLTGDQIRKARNAKGWTLRKLGGTLGVHYSLAGHWEKGTRTPSPDMEAQIRKVLDIQE